MEPITLTDVIGPGHPTPTAPTPTEAGVVVEVPTEEVEAGAGVVNLDPLATLKDSSDK